MSNNLETRIHEASHAIISLAFGVLPRKVTVDDDGGSVLYDDRVFAGLSDFEMVAIGMAGSLGVEQILGIVDTASDVDLRHVGPRLNNLTLSGVRWQVINRVQSKLEEMIYLHRDAIIALADGLLDQPTMSQRNLGECCKRSPALQHFAKLFPEPPKPTFPAVRPKTKPPRAKTQAPRQFNAPMMHAGYIIDRLLAGKGKMPRGMKRSEVVALVRERVRS